MEKPDSGSSTNITQAFDLKDGEGCIQNIELKISRSSLDIILMKTTHQEAADSDIISCVSIEFWEGKLTLCILDSDGEKQIPLLPKQQAAVPEPRNDSRKFLQR